MSFSNEVVEAAEDKRVWMIFYEDSEMRDSREIFSGCGAESFAWARFEQLQTNWNCTLFVSIAGPLLADCPAALPAEAMRAALEPFAEAAKGIPDSSHDAAPACRISHDALCPGTFTTINNAAFRRALTVLSASSAPEPAKSVGSVTHIPSSPLIVDDAPDPAEAMRAKTITVQGMFGPRSSHTLECPYPNTAKNCTCGGIDAALKGKWR